MSSKLKSSQTICQLPRLLTDNLLALGILVILNFILPRWLPGNPVDALIGDDIIEGYSSVELANLKEQMGLTGTLWEQFLIYLSNLSKGNLGYSVFHASYVTDLLAQAMPWTLLLMLCSLPLSLIFGAGLGLIAGAQRGKSFDRHSSWMVALLSSIPSFALAILLLHIFAIQLSWLPLSGATSLFNTPYHNIWLDIAWHATLPILALSLHSGVRYFYLARGIAITINQRPFLLAAKMRGISSSHLLIYYYGHNALGVLLAKLSGSVTMLMGAVLFIEVVFAYPGVGHLLLDAIQVRDYPLIQGILFMLSLLVLTINTLLDIGSNWLLTRG